jgi:rubrerythrin
MSPKPSEPWTIASFEELLQTASAMERQAICEYGKLATRMRDMGQPALAAVFDRLVAEETSHLAKVEDWSRTAGSHLSPDVGEAPPNVFDDEGAATVAPDLLSAYRAFSAAVRNEERAFAFWSYVSAHAQDDAVKQAAERMAREELGHVAVLRKERREAFHAERAAQGVAPMLIEDVEEALLQRLEALHGPEATEAQLWASEARERRAVAPTGSSRGRPPYAVGPIAQLSALALAEFLLEWRLAIAERAKTEAEAEHARSAAAHLLSCLDVLRELQGNAPSV